MPYHEFGSGRERQEPIRYLRFSQPRNGRPFTGRYFINSANLQTQLILQRWTGCIDRFSIFKDGLEIAVVLGELDTAKKVAYQVIRQES